MIATLMVLTGLLATASVGAARSRHGVTPKCPQANKAVLAADAQAVVYRAGTVVYEPEEHKFEEGPEEIFGCAYGAKHSYHFGFPPYGGPSGSGGVDHIALAGPVVAYEVAQTSPFVSGRDVNEVWVRNLRTGNVIHRMPDGSPSEPGDIGIGDTTAIVVKNDGSVAWIVGTSEQLGHAQIRSVDKTGSHVLAASPEINPNSLALAGNTLYWTQGNKPMSAVLN
jgi:hypothetical protein